MEVLVLLEKNFASQSIYMSDTELRAKSEETPSVAVGRQERSWAALRTG
jgi:hypothetical protein